MPLSYSRVRTAVLGVAAVAALTPIGLPAANASGTVPTPSPTRSLGTMSADAVVKRQTPLLDVANQILRVTGEGKTPGYSGYGDVTISVPDDTVTLYWHGDLPSKMENELAGLRAKAQVNVVSAPYTWQQLQGQIKRLFASRASLKASGVTLSRAAPALDAAGVLFDISVACWWIGARRFGGFGTGEVSVTGLAEGRHEAASVAGAWVARATLLGSTPSCGTVVRLGRRPPARMAGMMATACPAERTCSILDRPRVFDPVGRGGARVRHARRARIGGTARKDDERPGRPASPGPGP